VYVCIFIYVSVFMYPCLCTPAIYVSFGLQAESGLVNRPQSWPEAKQGQVRNRVETSKGKPVGTFLIVSYLRFCTDYIIYAKIDAQIECEFCYR